MPYVAQTDEGLVTVLDDLSTEPQCPDCAATFEQVTEHIRELPSGGSTTVNPHFRHSSGGSSGCSAGGGGGSGESKLHKRRKRAAMVAAVAEFECSDWDDEHTIGNKRADAYVEFEEPHEKYGRGLAIEYQHKNEQKNIGESLRTFASHEFTGICLWDEQFGDPSGIPDINLFGGLVVTPFPHALPSDVHEYDQRRPDEVLNDLLDTDCEIPARLPNEWYDQKALEIWRDQSYHKILSNPPFEVRPHHEYFWERFDLGPIDEIEVSLPPEVTDEYARELWEEHPWENLFDEPRTPHYLAQAAIPRAAATQPQDSGYISREMRSTLSYESTPWDSIVSDTRALPELPSKQHAIIPVSVPTQIADVVASQRSIRSGVRYSCTDCEYTGNKYAVAGSGAGTAVCPMCEGQLTI